jgi:hypothetical protein
MTTNIRSIDIKGVVSNKTRIKSKFFASTPSSEDSSSNEDTTAFFTTQKKNNKNIVNEELLPLNTKEYPQTPVSLDTFDEVLMFNKDAEFDGQIVILFPIIKSRIKKKSIKIIKIRVLIFILGNNRHPFETVIASSSNPTQVTRYNPDYESILESKRRQSNLIFILIIIIRVIK